MSENRATASNFSFSKTSGFRHASIAAGKQALLQLGKANGYEVDTTEDAFFFFEENLRHYSAIVFLNTTGDILNLHQQNALERFVQAGGGFVGIHAAADTEYDWPWYSLLVGGHFKSHPKVQTARIRIVDHNHLSTHNLPDEINRSDEWYDYKQINPKITVLAELDESSYEGANMGEPHPIMWYHEYDGGRAFYTGFGHTKECYSEKLFLDIIKNGIEYAIGPNQLDYTQARSKAMPTPNNFKKEVLISHLNEPMELAIAPDGRVFFTDRQGSVYLYNQKDKPKKNSSDQYTGRSEWQWTHRYSPGSGL
ncbi:MAG: ThuA domain-containing protein [Cytophagales bacterium]|nr:ThuA domain-containing protein [Cytophagales bacterium]